MIGIPVSSLLTAFGHTFPGATWLLFAPPYLFRDAFGKASVGRRLVGLGLASAESDAPPTLGARVLRGVPLTIPFLSLVEYFVAAYVVESAFILTLAAAPR